MGERETQEEIARYRAALKTISMQGYAIPRYLAKKALLEPLSEADLDARDRLLPPSSKG